MHARACVCFVLSFVNYNVIFFMRVGKFEWKIVSDLLFEIMKYKSENLARNLSKIHWKLNYIESRCV